MDLKDRNQGVGPKHRVGPKCKNSRDTSELRAAYRPSVTNQNQNRPSTTDPLLIKYSQKCVQPPEKSRNDVGMEGLGNPICGMRARSERILLDGGRPPISQPMASPNKCGKSNNLADRVPNAGLLYRRRRWAAPTAGMSRRARPHALRSPFK